MGVGPIPWRDVVYYAEFVELESDLVPVFVRTIRAMDSIYLKWSDKKSETKKPKIPRKPEPSGTKSRKR